MFTKEWFQENKHLVLWRVIIFCAYLLYQKNQGHKIPQSFIDALPTIGGLAFGVNTLITLIK